jgi:hypothetical protein
MQLAYDQRWQDYRVIFDVSLVYKFIGILIYQSIFNLDNVSAYWSKRDGMPLFPLMQHMSEKTFWRVLAVFHFSGKSGG